MLRFSRIFLCLVSILYQVTCSPQAPNSWSRNYQSKIPIKNTYQENYQSRANDQSCVCGKSDARLTKPPQTSEIEKGHAVNPPYKYPWMVAIFKDRELHCGATIITRDFLLTAAHCFAKVSLKDIRVSFVGEEHSFNHFHPVKHATVHPQFDYKTGEHDIALVQLTNPITCGRYTRPICFPNIHFHGVKGGHKLVTGGWGNELKGQRRNNNTVQLETTMQVMDEKECAKWSKGKKNYVCMIGVYNQGICQGDSGGPLINLDRKSQAHIVAVASNHYDSKCDSRYPQFFIDVRHYVKWIQDNIHRRRSEQTRGPGQTQPARAQNIRSPNTIDDNPRKAGPLPARDLVQPHIQKGIPQHTFESIPSRYGSQMIHRYFPRNYINMNKITYNN